MQLTRAEALLARLLESVAVLLMVALVVAIAWSVLGRQVFRFSVAWSEEVGAGLLVWMVMLGAAAAWARRRHIAIDLLLRMSRPGPRHALEIFVELASLLLLGVALIGSISMVEAGANNVTTALRISYSYLYLALAMGLGAMILFSLLHLGRLILGGPAAGEQETDPEDEWNISSSS